MDIAINSFLVTFQMGFIFAFAVYYAFSAREFEAKGGVTSQ